MLATTNMPWELDIAALRRYIINITTCKQYLFDYYWMINRFERRILLPMPDLKAREEIFRLHIDMRQKLSDNEYKSLA